MVLADTVLQELEAEVVMACTGLEVVDHSDQPLPLLKVEHTAAGVAIVVAHDEVIG